MIEHISFEEIIKESLKEGGEFSDLFFEQTHSVSIICEEDRIEKVISGLDMG
ncbi:MAG: TldD/PmbA family protein, partial [Syntrophaceae bacterium]|nr:TldD/PmbA family protein [Syntrophaceae bacterium]